MKLEEAAMASATPARPIITYFVNLIGGPGGATPYSPAARSLLMSACRICFRSARLVV